MNSRKAYHLFIILCGLLVISCRSTSKQTDSAPVQEIDAHLKPAWITSQDSLPKENAWLIFRKKVNIERQDDVSIKIAVDSKYWLYINGEMVVFEGGLKRGPSPDAYYYDEIDISNYLKRGENTLGILMWYFGKDGMSHQSSGYPALMSEVSNQSKKLVVSDASWKVMQHPAYLSKSEPPYPNWRLPESNVVFDARRDIKDWYTPDYSTSQWLNANILPDVNADWSNMRSRPIPQWKDFGLKAYQDSVMFPFESDGDTLIVDLPYNAQITPYLKVQANEGQKISILTDHYKGGSAYNVRAEYITKQGVQEYESMGWMNGEKVFYVIPKGITVLDLKYRETGYDTEFSGSFSCDDAFYNKLWKKARRTLYVTMRDTYMDCPDRERAQWWGDVVLESGEAFYALDRKADALMKKGMYELMNWQRKDSTIFSPIPAGNWDKELPGQMLASIGYYGFWNYYWQTGDLQPLKELYQPVKEYLSVYTLNASGTLDIRQGGWFWGDWGEHKEMELLQNTQYYLALKGLLLLAEELGYKKDADQLSANMSSFKKAFNKHYWKTDHYRSGDYTGKIDDRSQGLAVVSGLAAEDKYDAISKVLQVEKHASPYMEKYILEALFQMGEPELALQRMKERFGVMVNHPTITTLWEGWGIGAEGYGGGTTNHAWSGGGLTLLSQYVAGIAPTSPGYQTFDVKPQPGFLKYIKAVVPSIKGNIHFELSKGEDYKLIIEVPKDSEASIYIPKQFTSISINNGKVDYSTTDTHNIVIVKSGKYIIEGKGN
ncbi:glycoside hydrolase family 78 protein [Gangjinia marincola]|uniref:Glycoside hydrolase family 78 protein n=1 Tax=Gangjinia marincola TaxID=578463 RepID=A0ABP3XY62_9FLAO